MDTIAVGIADGTRTADPRPRRLASKRLRRTKVATAFLVTSVVGIASYSTTYHVLEVMSTPAPASGTVTTVGSHTAPVSPASTPSRQQG